MKSSRHTFQPSPLMLYHCTKYELNHVMYIYNVLFISSGTNINVSLQTSIYRHKKVITYNNAKVSQKV